MTTDVYTVQMLESGVQIMKVSTLIGKIMDNIFRRI